MTIEDDGTIVYAEPPLQMPRIWAGSAWSWMATRSLPVSSISTLTGHGITFGEEGAPRGRAPCLFRLGCNNRRSGASIEHRCTGCAYPSAPRPAVCQILDRGSFPGAQPLGLHLEGPYLNPEQKGTFHPAWLRSPVIEEVRALLVDGRGWIRQMTLAPELPHATEVAALLRDASVTAALGHSNTDYTTASQALAGPFTHVTHTFNAQRGFHHREPGVLGAVLASDAVTAELIADTVHVHPGAMKVLLRCLGTERVVLVTDAMAAAGLGDGKYELLGHAVFVKNGAARQANGNDCRQCGYPDLRAPQYRASRRHDRFAKPSGWLLMAEALALGLDHQRWTSKLVARPHLGGPRSGSGSRDDVRPRTMRPHKG